MLERADASRARTTARTRKITMPDGKVRYDAVDPKEIAAELRANSRLGKREAKLKAAEAKIAR